MTTLEIQAKYEVYSVTPITLPEGKTDNDIGDIFVEYGLITITFKDGTNMEVEENSVEGEYEYPDQIRLYSWVDKVAEVKYEKQC